MTIKSAKIMKDLFFCAGIRLKWSLKRTEHIKTQEFLWYDMKRRIQLISNLKPSSGKSYMALGIGCKTAENSQPCEFNNPYIWREAVWWFYLEMNGKDKLNMYIIEYVLRKAFKVWDFMAYKKLGAIETRWSVNWCVC